MISRQQRRKNINDDLIKTLEKELGFPLFERKNRRVELTDAGKEFYDSISCLVAEYNASIQRVREMTERE